MHPPFFCMNGENWMTRYENTKTYDDFDWSEYASCIIVGNAPVLMEDENGPFIDSFDCVVRMNAAEIYGFEPNVGEKETLRWINGALQFCREVRTHSQTERYWLNTVRNKNLFFVPRNNAMLRKGLEETHDSNTVHLATEHFKIHFNSLRDTFGRLPSTGTHAIRTAQDYFDEVHVIGFQWGDGHYWEEFLRREDHLSHIWEVEKEWAHSQKDVIIH